MLLSHGRYVLLGMVAALAWAAGGVLAPPGGAAAQPQPTMVLSPSSGPCDASVEVTLTGFSPSTPVPIDIGRPHADGSIGTVTTVMTDANGQFRGQVTLGGLGCEAASFDDLLDGPGDPKEIHMWAGYQPARRFVPARSVYTYTTTESSPGVVPRALPRTGGGLVVGAPRPWAMPVAMVLGGMGLIMIAASFYARRRAHRRWRP
jgi:hypothetical protein